MSRPSLVLSRSVGFVGSRGGSRTPAEVKAYPVPHRTILRPARKSKSPAESPAYVSFTLNCAALSAYVTWFSMRLVEKFQRLRYFRLKVGSRRSWLSTFGSGTFRL